MQKVLATFSVIFFSIRLVYADGFGSTDYIVPFGHTVFRAAAQKSSTDTNVVAVGRAWTGSQYKAVIASYLTTSGLADNLFVGNQTNGNFAKQYYDFAGAGFDNLCTSIVYAYDGFVAGCRSMKANGLYDIYLVKFNNNGLLDTSFSTNGIKATALGGSTTHAFPRGIVYDAATGNGGENGTVVLTGQIGSYGTVFHPFIAAFSQKTGAQYGSTATISGINGTGVAIAIDTTVPNYYIASTDTSNNHNFYVSKFDSSLSSSGSPWGTAVDFTKAIGDAAADSVPSSIMINGSDVITLGGNRVDTTAAWRCAAVAHTMSSGNLDTTFGKVPSPLVAGVNSTGISLFALSTTRDCIINSAVTPPSGSNILPVGTIYNGTNYDFLVAKLSNVGALDTSFSTDGIVIQTSGPADDVLNSAVYLDGSNNNIYGFGRSQHSSLYNGGALVQVTTTAGTYTDNVVLSLDVAKASSTLTFPGSGCLDTTFRDLSSRANNAAMSGFNSCGASSGWNGSGSGNDPYRLTFDGTNDYAVVSQIRLSDTTDYAVTVWYKGTDTEQNSHYGKGIIGRDNNDFYANFSIRSGYPTFIHYNGGWLQNVASLITTADDYWYHLALVNHTNETADFYVNGKAQVTGQSSSIGDDNYPYRIDHLMRGYDGKYTSGSLGKIRVEKRALSSSEIFAKFITEADDYRATPVGNILKNGLVLNYDPANAKQGMSAYTNGCAAGDLNYSDLSSSAITGTLTGFSSCGTSTGWNGDGTTSISGANGPYRLSIDGSDDLISVTGGFTNTVSGDDTHTISMWVYPTSLAGQGAVLLDAADGGGFEYFIEFNTTVGFYWGVGGSYRTYSGMSLSTNNWYNITVVKTGAGDSGNFYLNGVLQSTYAGNLSSIGSGASKWLIGCYRGPSFCQAGHLTNVLMYNRALSASEVLHNCNALKSRYSGATCG